MYVACVTNSAFIMKPPLLKPDFQITTKNILQTQRRILLFPFIVMKAMLSLFLLSSFFAGWWRIELLED